MTEKQGGLKRRVNLKIGKSLEIQEIVRIKGKKWEKTAVKTGRKGQPGRRISLRGSPKPRAPDGEDYQVYRLSAKEYMGLSAIGLGLCGLTAYVFYRSFFAFILLMPLGFLYPIYKKKDLKKKRLRQLTLQFKEAIQVLSSFLSAGYSLENGLFMSVRELEALYGKDAMITEEFERLAAGVRMNRPVEQLLAEFGERSGIQDVDHFAQVFGMARRSGGELVEIIRQSAGVIRDKIQVQEEIQTMTAARIFEQKIMNGIPFGMILYIDFTSPGFFDIMYGTWMGRLIMTLCLAFYMGAVMLSGKILDIEI